MDEEPRGLKGMLIELGVHLVLMLAVCVALYPVLWVITLALSPGDAPEARLLPFPTSPSLEHVERVVSTTSEDGTWLFGLQLASSLVVAFATALVAIVIATPAAYALARFDFVGQKGAEKALLATQMFPGVAASIPLYLLLHTLGLLDTRSGLILVYATTAVPFAIFQLRGAFEGIPRDLEEAAMVDGASRLGAFVRVVLPAAIPSTSSGTTCAPASSVSRQRIECSGRTQRRLPEPQRIDLGQGKSRMVRESTSATISAAGRPGRSTTA